MPKPRPHEAVFAALCELGAGRPAEVARHLHPDGQVGQVRRDLEILRREGRVEFFPELGSLYRPIKAPVSFERSGSPWIVYNDPPALSTEMSRVRAHHPSIATVALDAAFAALIRNSRKRLRIASPFIDYPSIQRFLPEFEQAFTGGARLTLVVRGIANREARTFPHEYTERVRGLIQLRDLYVRAQGSVRGFTVLEFLERDLTALRPRTRSSDQGAGGRLEAALHQKVIVSDDMWAYVGSGEFRFNSFNATGELGAIFGRRHAAFVGDLVQAYASRAVPINTERFEDLLAPA